ncbi:hypothetical protein C0993_009285 [Termitomyces sp. T159_Od127]|nr:hypothetical protein C0993_009285 [Termitomyces sp. T159_Od127]
MPRRQVACVKYRPVAGQAPLALLEEHNLLQQLLKRSIGVEAENNVLDTALKWVRPEDAYGYFKIVAKLFGPSNHPKSSLSMTNLGWVNIEDKTQPRSWPDFANCEADPVKCIGIIPFMSGEVITMESLHTIPGSSYPPFVHEAIHDIKSLLWVLVCLCLIQSGPGIKTRHEELDKNSPLFDPKLQDLIPHLFEGSQKEIETTKRGLHRTWTSFEEQVIMHFHPYFDPLKPLVLKWWNTVILGYRYCADKFYNIHSHILCLINKTIDHIKTIPDNDKAKQAELDHRK